LIKDLALFYSTCRGVVISSVEIILGVISVNDYKGFLKSFAILLGIVIVSMKPEFLNNPTMLKIAVVVFIISILQDTYKIIIDKKYKTTILTVINNLLFIIILVSIVNLYLNRPVVDLSSPDGHEKYYDGFYSKFSELKIAALVITLFNGILRLKKFERE
jgi:hypothetical protein